MIYVIQQGEYSDKHIVMATTDKEFAYDTAERMRKEINGYRQPSIEVFEFEDGKTVNYLPMWEVALWDNPVTVELTEWYTEEEEFGSTYVVRASNADVALKIASDRHAQRIAEMNAI